MALDAAQLSTMIASLTGRPDDPRVQGVIKLLASAFGGDDDADEKAARRAARAAARTAERRRVAMQRVAQIQRLVESMTARNRFVAGALGACECWGTDPRCAQCGGRGTPGAYAPERSAFELIVVPLVRERAEMFHALPGDWRRDALTRDTEPGGMHHG